MAEPKSGSGPLLAALWAIARDVADDRALAGLICRACVHWLEVDGAALSLMTASEARHTLYASDATAELLEELQFSLNEGACIEAARGGHPVFVTDLHQHTEGARWPVFAAAVLEQTPVRTLCALPLRWGTVNLGVLDLYRRAPGGLGDAQRRDALAAADIAALMLLTLYTDPDHGIDPDHRADSLAEPDGVATRVRDDGGGSWLHPVVAGRAEVHQATGMVMDQLGLNAADALARLRGHAFAQHRLLIEVARDVVARQLEFTEHPRSPENERGKP